MVLGVSERMTISGMEPPPCSLFCIRRPVGSCVSVMPNRHRASEFLAFLKGVEGHVPRTLMCISLWTTIPRTSAEEVRKWLAQRTHRYVHCTPTSSSWINHIERWFAELTRKQLKRGVYRSVAALEKDIMECIAAHNGHPKP